MFLPGASLAAQRRALQLDTAEDATPVQNLRGIVLQPVGAVSGGDQCRLSVRNQAGGPLGEQVMRPGT